MATHKHELEIGTVTRTSIIFDCRTCSHSRRLSKVWIYERLQGVPIKKAKRPRYR